MKNDIRSMCVFACFLSDADRRRRKLKILSQSSSSQILIPPLSFDEREMRDDDITIPNDVRRQQKNCLLVAQKIYIRIMPCRLPAGTLVQ